MAESFDDKSQEVAVLGRPDTVMGIPLPFFAFAILLGGVLGLLVAWAAGLGLGFISLFGLYTLHEDDPQALDLWIERIRSRVRKWEAGKIRRRRILLIKMERTD